ncbi:MAG: hypothetical protein R3A80_06315 [Bdellovibrionota bacterium]
MNALQWVDEKPLREKLSQELAGLSKDLLKLEQSVESYFTQDLPQFQTWLTYHFADQLAQISDLERKVCALGHHLEESLKLSVDMDLRPEDLFANWTREQMLEKVFSDEVSAEESVQEDLPVSEKKNISGDARDVYRRIVRCLHPDLRGALTGAEKNLWVKAQQAYARDDAFELRRIEHCLRCGDLKAEPLTCSEMMKQASEFRKKFLDLKSELECIQNERAWNFCKKKSYQSLEREIEIEYRSTLKALKAKESHLTKTLDSWLTQDTVVPAAKQRRRAPKTQQSLF